MEYKFTVPNEPDELKNAYVKQKHCLIKAD